MSEDKDQDNETQKSRCQKQKKAETSWKERFTQLAIKALLVLAVAFPVFLFGFNRQKPIVSSQYNKVALVAELNNGNVSHQNKLQASQLPALKEEEGVIRALKEEEGVIDVENTISRADHAFTETDDALLRSKQPINISQNLSLNLNEKKFDFVEDIKKRNIDDFKTFLPWFERYVYLGTKPALIDPSRIEVLDPIGVHFPTYLKVPERISVQNPVSGHTLRSPLSITTKTKRVDFPALTKTVSLNYGRLGCDILNNTLALPKSSRLSDFAESLAKSIRISCFRSVSITKRSDREESTLMCRRAWLHHVESKDRLNLDADPVLQRMQRQFGRIVMQNRLQVRSRERYETLGVPIYGYDRHVVEPLELPRDMHHLAPSHNLGVEPLAAPILNEGMHINPIPVQTVQHFMAPAENSNQPVLGLPLNQPVLGLPLNQPVLGLPLNQPVLGLPLNQPVLGLPLNQPVLGLPLNQPVLGLPLNELYRHHPVIDVPTSGPFGFSLRSYTSDGRCLHTVRTNNNNDYPPTFDVNLEQIKSLSVGHSYEISILNPIFTLFQVNSKVHTLEKYVEITIKRTSIDSMKTNLAQVEINLSELGFDVLRKITDEVSNRLPVVKPISSKLQIIFDVVNPFVDVTAYAQLGNQRSCRGIQFNYELEYQRVRREEIFIENRVMARIREEDGNFSAPPIPNAVDPNLEEIHQRSFQERHIYVRFNVNLTKLLVTLANKVDDWIK